MEQFWKLVNITKKEQLFTNDDLELHEILVEGSLAQLVELLRKPSWIPLSKLVIYPQGFKSKPPLLKLPREIMDMIITHIAKDSPESLIFLSLTCVYCFRLLCVDFQRNLADDIAPWAGDRLVFVADDAHDLDIRGICTTAEACELEEKYGSNPLYNMPETMTCTMDHVGTASKDPFVTHGLLGLRQAGSLEFRVRGSLKSDDLNLFGRLATLAKRAKPSNNDHEKNISVLRSITDKKYVREDGITGSDYAYSLGEAVGVLTTWSGGGCGLMNLDAKGEWAGHRVDITTMADITEEWTDVSERAIEKLITATT